MKPLGPARALPVFTVVASVVYLLGMMSNDGWLLFYPNINEIHVTRQPKDAGIVMFWYGWVVDALAAGILAGGLALALPGAWLERFWRHGTAGALTLTCVGMIAVFALLREYFVQ